MKHFVRTVMTVALVLILTGCSLFVKDCAQYSDDPAAYQQCRAEQGDPAAQYDLGRAAYAAQDYAAAVTWLKLAAAPRSGRTPVYMPPVSGQQYGTVMMLDSGPGTTGHAGAQLLLAEIYEKGLGVAADPKRAADYRERAGKSRAAAPENKP